MFGSSWLHLQNEPGNPHDDFVITIIKDYHIHNESHSTKLLETMPAPSI